MKDGQSSISKTCVSTSGNQEWLAFLYTWSVIYWCSYITLEPLIATLKRSTRVAQPHFFLTYFYSQDLWSMGMSKSWVTSHPTSSMTKLAAFDHVSASAKVKQPFSWVHQVCEEAELGAGPQHGDAGSTAGRTGPAWHCLAVVKAIGLGWLANRRWKGEAAREEGKELVWKSSCILHLHLMLDRTGLDRENDYVYSACLHRDTLFLGNIHYAMPPKSTWHLETC